MRAEVICLLAAQVATAADLLHPNLLNVAYSANLDRCDGWNSVTEFFEDNPPTADKAKNDNRGFYRTETEYGTQLSTKKEQCFCALDDQNPAYWEFQTSTALQNVQTIVVISIDMALNFSFSMSTSSNGTTFTQICAQGVCQLGANDFSASPLADFTYLRIQWAKDVQSIFCNVFVYNKKNYTPSATITTNFKYPDPDSYDYMQWPNGLFQGTKRWGYDRSKSLYDDPTDNTNTCFNQYNSGNDSATRLSPMMFEFPLHMVIHDIFMVGGDHEMQTHIVRALNLNVHSQTITEIDDHVTSKNWSQNIDKYGNNENSVIKEISNFKNARNHACTASECSEWNVKRVILTNKDANDRFFWLCGVAIMAEPVPCPPTNNNCANIKLQPWYTSSADFSLWQLDPGETIVTDPFEFRDTLTDQCHGYTPPAAGCTKTFSLMCKHCNDFPANCVGLSPPPYTAATFTWSIDRTNAAFEEYELTITSSGDLTNVINHRCKIECKLHGQNPQESEEFVIKEQCPPCSSTTIAPQTDGTSTPVVGTIPFSKTAQSFSWKWFSSTVRDCGVMCNGIDYSTWCRRDTDETFTSDLDFTALLSVSSSIGDYTIQLLANDLSLHQVLYWCKIVGESLDTGIFTETDVFDVMFDACIDPKKSCDYNTWSSQKPAGWTAPPDISVFLDNVSSSSSFDYSNWYDKFYNICGSQDVCGTVSFQFIDDLNTEITSTTYALHPAVTVTQETDKITLSVASLDPATVGTYKVKVKGIMTLHGGANDWTGPALSVIWSYFTVNIVDPCSLSNACEYTTVVVDPFTASSLTDMLAYFDNVQVTQTYVAFSDTVTNLCPFACSGYQIKLVYESDDSQVPTDLASLTTIGGSPAISVKTTNYAYAGTHTVKIKCAIVQGGATVSYKYSNAFDIDLDPCDTKSCLYSSLIALTASDTQPSDYAIGVDNVAGYTDFTPFSNTCGQACTSNIDICGRPTYTTLYTRDMTTVPTFQSLTDSSTYIRQSSQTFDLNDEGVHVLIIKVSFDMSVFSHGGSTYVPQPQNLYTDSFTVTVDVCSPLPCDYNEILLPAFGATMPEGMYVRTTGDVVSSYFTPYQDAVSLRCSNPYTDLCGAKTYTIEKTDGTPIPGATMTQTYDSVRGLFRLDVSSTDNTAVALYQTRINVGFAAAYSNVIDETSYEFQLIIDAEYPCAVIDCQLNALVQIDETSTEYVLPSDFVVGTDYTWGFSEFDSWNDTKTEYCKGEAGMKDGISYSSFLAPICNWPIYELVDASTGASMTPIFGAGNIDIRFDYFALYTSRWKVKVRANNPSLDGFYDVKIKVKLSATTNPYYTNQFTIEVSDPCMPYSCADTVFSPVDDSEHQDIEYTFGSGYQASAGPLWDNYINEICGSKTQNLCGPTRFVLVDAATDEPVTFSHLIYKSMNNVVVSVQITDETLIGKTLQVYLVGYGYDDSTQTHYGTNGTSSVFDIVIGEPEEVVLDDLASGDGGPYFSVFPVDIVYDRISGPEYLSYAVQSVAENSVGRITAIVVSLGSAIDFVTYSVQGNEVLFTFELTHASPVGSFVISQTVVNDSGQSVKSSFTIMIIETLPIEEAKNTASTQGQPEEQEPLGAVIQSISMTGEMVIQYSRTVLPLDTLTPITSSQFQIVFEQLSDEIDQTEDFTFDLIEMTPKTIKVQLHFSRPLEVSQGLEKDRVHVRMTQALFMVEDADGVYTEWVPGQNMAKTLKTQRIIDRLPSSYYAQETSYYIITGTVPKQVDNLDELEFLDAQIDIIVKALSGLFFGPLALHLFGFGTMDYSWVAYSNMQMMTVIGQFNLKLPQNVERVLQTIAPEINYQFLDPVKTYQIMRTQSSDNPNYVARGYPEPYTYYGSDAECSEDSEEECEEEGRRRLQENGTELTFEQSRFYEMGANDLVLVTSSQLVVCLLVLLLFAFWGFVLEKSFLFWLPVKIKVAFHYLKDRIFWCLPIRLILQQYVVVTSSAIINLRFRNNSDTVENSVNRLVSVCVLLGLTVGLPTFIFVFVLRLPDSIKNNPLLLKKYDSLFLSVDWAKAKARFMLGFSLYRKAVLVWVAIGFDLNVLQFALAVYLQEFYVAYIINYKPMLGALRNKVEFFNEIVILFTIFLQCTLTDYVPDPKIRYVYFGWTIVCLIYLQLVVNTIFLVRGLYHQCKRIFKIIKFHIVVRHRTERNLVHNLTVETLGSHKPKEDLKPYLKNTDLVIRHKRMQNDLDMIQSLGSDEEGSSNFQSHNLNNSLASSSLQKKRNTLSARRRRFQERMRQMETQLPTITHNSVAQLRESQRKEVLDPDGRFQIDHGEMHDWHALPLDFSNPEKSISISLDSEDQRHMQMLEHKMGPEEDLWLVETKPQPSADQISQEIFEESIQDEQPTQLVKVPTTKLSSNRTQQHLNVSKTVQEPSQNHDSQKRPQKSETISQLDISLENSQEFIDQSQIESFQDDSHIASSHKGREEDSITFVSVAQSDHSVAQKLDLIESNEMPDRSVFHPPSVEEEAPAISESERSATIDDDSKSVVFDHDSESQPSAREQLSANTSEKFTTSDFFTKSNAALSDLESVALSTPKHKKSESIEFSLYTDN